MMVTEQVDALRALAIDPHGYLVVPRFVAMMVMLTLLMVLGDLFAIAGAGMDAPLLYAALQTWFHAEGSMRLPEPTSRALPVPPEPLPLTNGCVRLRPSEHCPQRDYFGL